MGKPKKSTKKFLKTKLKDELSRRKKHKEATKHIRKSRPSTASVDGPIAKSESIASDDDNESNASSDIGFGPSIHGQGEDSDTIDPYLETSDGDLSENDSDAPDEIDDIEHLDEDDLDEDEELTEKRNGESADEDEDAMTHMQQMELLKKKDPKFYQYLKENDQELLDFAASDDDDDDQDKDGSDAGTSDDESGSAILVTPAMVREWRTRIAKQNSTRCLHKVLLAFRAAVAIDDGSEAMGDFTYRVEEGKVFNTVVLIALKYSTVVFNHVLFGADIDGKPRKGLPSGAKKWGRIQKLVKAFLSTTLKFMQQMTDTSMLSFMLKQCENAAAYFACFPKQRSEFLKRIVHYWAFSEQEQVRILAFLCLRRLAIAAPNPNLQSTIKGTYSSFLEVSRSTNVHSWTHINFMGNCIIELCGIHLPTTYQLAFVYIRQMAIKLRSSITSKTKESFKSVYNWQFLQSIRLWSRMLATYCNVALGNPKDTEVLQPLIYPLVQIAIGVMRVKPSSRHFPFRLQIIKALIELMNKTGTFIPVAAYLFDILHSAEVSDRSKTSTLKALDFSLTIQAPNSYLGTKPFQRGLIEETVHMLFEYYSSFALSISFPELIIPAIIELKHISKNSKDMHLNKFLIQLVEKLDQNGTFIENKRSGLDFGPKDSKRIEEFLADIPRENTPLGKFNTARLKMRSRQKPQDLVVPGDEDEDENEDDDIHEDQYENSSDGSDNDAPSDDDDNGDFAALVSTTSNKRKQGSSQTSTTQPKAAKKGKVVMKPSNSKSKGDLVDEDEDIVDDFVLSDEE
ncbi:hypothetical protein BASA61_006059 [Batrachochytrium salamandrivorans]|nr:hypothetical protein BASA61_006059 [Batrachochytrium salamandrivorans]